MVQVRVNVFFLFVFFSIGSGWTSNVPTNITASENYAVDRYTTTNIIPSPRSLIRDDFGDILVVSQETSQIIAIFEDGDKRVKTAVIIAGTNGLNLNHGLEYNEGYLYASTSSQVLRWGYSPGQRSTISRTPEVVVQGIPADGKYVTRSIIVDRYNFLYVSVGAAKNVEESKTRAQIRRFNLAEGLPENGYNYEDGEEFATGVRNAVGLAVDLDNGVWGADCGADDLKRPDLGDDIHNTNPADELIRFDNSKLFYGYPYCWTVDELPGGSKGDQYAWPDFMGDDKEYTDKWCRDKINNQPPTFVLPAHNAPLGLVFYDGVGCGTHSDSFPCSMKGDLFIAFHGSTNRKPPSGYKVARMAVNQDTGFLSGILEDVVFQNDTSACESEPDSCFRPVDLVFSQHGHLIISSDASNDILRVTYKNSGASDFVSYVKKSIHVPGIIALAVIALITTCLVIMIVHRYCCRCRRTEEVPYKREQI